MTDLGNAERFAARFRDRLLWCRPLGWLYWDGQRWSQEGAEERVLDAEHVTVRMIPKEARWLRDHDADKVIGERRATKKRRCARAVHAFRGTRAMGDFVGRFATALTNRKARTRFHERAAFWA